MANRKGEQAEWVNVWELSLSAVVEEPDEQEPTPPSSNRLGLLDSFTDALAVEEDDEEEGPPPTKESGEVPEDKEDPPPPSGRAERLLALLASPPIRRLPTREQEMMAKALKHICFVARGLSAQNPHVAFEDMVQTGLLVAVQKVPTWRAGEAQFATYIRRAVRGKMLSLGRKAWLTAFRERGEHRSGEEKAPGSEPPASVGALAAQSGYLVKPIPVDERAGHNHQTARLKRLLEKHLPRLTADEQRLVRGLLDAPAEDVSEVATRLKMGTKRAHNLKASAFTKLERAAAGLPMDARKKNKGD